MSPTGPWDDAMRLALTEARSALAADDVPVGAVVLDASGAVVGTGHNTRESHHDPTGHAEVVAGVLAAESTALLDGFFARHRSPVAQPDI